MLGYDPQVRVEEGVGEFVKWFKEYQVMQSHKDEVSERNGSLE